MEKQGKREDGGRAREAGEKREVDRGREEGEKEKRNGQRATENRAQKTVSVTLLEVACCSRPCHARDSGCARRLQRAGQR